MKNYYHRKHTPEGIPVPQADDINKVIDLVTYLVDNPSNKYQIADHFEFDERQGDYYANAGCYIGLLEKVGALYQPTDSGKSIAMIENRHTRNVRVIEHCLRTALFNDLSRMYFQKKGNIPDGQIISRLEKEGLTGSTPQRRKSTVIAWIKWIAMNLEE